MRSRVLHAGLIVVALATLALAEEEKHPLAAAKGGEWLLTKTVHTTSEKTETSWLYRWVSKVDGNKVTVMVQVMKDDKVAQMAPAPTYHDLGAKIEDRYAGGKVSDDEIEHKGKKLKCKKVELKKDDHTVTFWRSTEIPITNEVKQVEKDKDGTEVVRVEAVDHGLTGGAERPRS